MANATEAGDRFEALRADAKSRPVTIEDGEGDTFGADVLLGWLAEIAEKCRTRGLIGEDRHAELLRCTERFGAVLGTIPPAALRDVLAPPDDELDTELDGDLI